MHWKNHTRIVISRRFDLGAARIEDARAWNGVRKLAASGHVPRHSAPSLQADPIPFYKETARAIIIRQG